MMKLLRSFLTLSLLAVLATSAKAQVRAVYEGKPTTNNTVKIDTTNNRVDIDTDSYNGGLPNVGLYLTKDIVLSTGPFNSCIIYATGTVSCPSLASQQLIISGVNSTSGVGQFAIVTSSGIHFLTSGTGITWADGSVSTSASGGSSSVGGGTQAWITAGNVVLLSSSSNNVLIQSTLTVSGSAFSVGSATFVVINGNVGISSANPGALLVVGSTYVANGPFQQGINVGATNATVAVSDGVESLLLSVNVGQPQINVATNHSLSLKTNNNDRVRISATGNVGIGTTGPTQVLDVNGNVNSLGGYQIGGLAPIGKYLKGDGSLYVSSSIIPGDLPVNGYSGTYVQKAGDSMTGGLTVGNNSTMTVQGPNFSVGYSTIVIGNGQVGIGTSNPSSSTLYILDSTNNDALFVESLSVTSNSDIHFKNISVQGPFMDYWSANERWGFGIRSNGNFALRASNTATDPVNGSAVLDLSPTGNLGVGVVNPAYALDVLGDEHVSGSGYYGSGITATSGTFTASGATQSSLQISSGIKFNDGTIQMTAAPASASSTFTKVNANATQFTGDGTAGNTLAINTSSITALGNNPPAANIGAGTLPVSVVTSSVANSGVSGTTCGSATQSCVLTFRNDGRITSQSNAVISGGGGGSSSGPWTDNGAGVISPSTGSNSVLIQSSITLTGPFVLGNTNQTLAYGGAYYGNGWTLVGSTWVGGPGSGTNQTLGASAVTFTGLPTSNQVQYRMTFNIAGANTEIPAIRINATTNGYSEQNVAVSTFVAVLDATAASKCQMTYIPNYGTVFDTVSGQSVAASALIQSDLSSQNTLIQTEFLYKTAAGHPTRISHRCTSGTTLISSIELSYNSNGNFVGTVSLEMRQAPAP